jgi:serine/threonine-protein kinase
MPLLKSLIKRDWFIGLVITLLFLIFAEIGLFSAFDRQAYNLGVKFSSAREPNEKIVVVAIDDKSLQALGAWPWSRDVLAESMKLLTMTKPSVVGFTMPFDTGQYQAGLISLAELRKILKKQKKLSRSVNKALRMTESALQGDNNLAKTFKSGGRIVLSMQYIPTSEPTPGLTSSLPGYMQRFALPKVSVNGNSDRGFGWHPRRRAVSANRETGKTGRRDRRFQPFRALQQRTADRPVWAGFSAFVCADGSHAQQGHVDAAYRIAGQY